MSLMMPDLYTYSDQYCIFFGCLAFANMACNWGMMGRESKYLHGFLLALYHASLQLEHLVSFLYGPIKQTQLFIQ